MNVSPFISMAMAESRQRELRTQAQRARLAREATAAAKAGREAAEPGTPRRVARRRWRLGLTTLFGAS
jgi:hypothetical protein